MAKKQQKMAKKEEKKAKKEEKTPEIAEFPDIPPLLHTVLDHTDLAVFHAAWKRAVAVSHEKEGDAAKDDDNKLFYIGCPFEANDAAPGASLWVTYSPDYGDPLLPCKGNGANVGIALIVLSSSADSVRGGVPASVRHFIPFERFNKCFLASASSWHPDFYFGSEPAIIGEWGAEYLGNFPHEEHARVWLRQEEGTLGIEITAAQGDFSWIERFYRQQDGTTWVHAYSHWGWWYEDRTPRVGLSFLSEDGVAKILRWFTRKGFRVEDDRVKGLLQA